MKNNNNNREEHSLHGQQTTSTILQSQQSQQPHPHPTQSSFLVTTQLQPHPSSILNQSTDLHSTSSTANKKSTNQIFELYNQIHSTINDMDTKVEHVIKKHEAEFLFAYRNHIKKIKKELSEIKYKSEEQEKMFSSNDRIQYLEQQLAIFRDQTMKIYNKLDQKNLQIDILKLRVKDLEKQAAYANGELKEHVKKSMFAGMNRLNYQEKIETLENQLQAKDKQIQRLNIMIKSQSGQEQNNNKSSLKQNSSGYGSKTFIYDHLKKSDYSKTSPLNKQPKSPTRSQNTSVHVTSTNFYNNLRSPLPSPRVYQTDLKNWFLECIKTVKREIAQRNNQEKSLELTNISSIDEFMMIDKLRLLEIFLENERLLTYMYERIFPDRLSSLRDKLSATKPLLMPKSQRKEPNILTERQEKVSSFNEDLLIDRYKTHAKIGHLPKVMTRISENKPNKLAEKGQWKGNVILKDGKLNISMQ